MIKVSEISPDSPLYDRVQPGWSVRKVNGADIEDSIDFRFKTAVEKLRLLFTDRQGKPIRINMDNVDLNDLGLIFHDDPVRTCGNKCIFCFVHQQPKGMRRSLYIRDEDYRLSFTHGNFVTLTNLTEQDIRRIVKQRLSPLYVSVHTTNEKLRQRMLGKTNISPILPLLKRLTRNSIAIHTQVVLCPGINDGDELKTTISELAELAPGVESLAVVPVGLTKYRERLPKLRSYRPEEAAEIVRLIEKYQRQFLKRFQTRFLWAADEFFILAGLDFPRYYTYEEMHQFENGVGMVREFVTAFNRRRRVLAGIRSKKRAVLLTGHSAFPFLQRHIMPYLTEHLGLDVEFRAVVNRFWGETVTVSGLLTGEDLLAAGRKHQGEVDTIVLPPNCLNADNLFLDGMSLDQFRTSLEKPVVTGSYHLTDTVREVFV